MADDVLLQGLGSANSQEVHRTLVSLTARTKSSEEVEELFEKKFFSPLFCLLSKEDGSHRVLVLSILANCSNVSTNWRKTFIDANGIDVLVLILQDSSEPNLISRTVRLLANLSKEHDCLNKLHENFIIQSLVKFAASESPKCQVSCLRAIRIICSTSRSAKQVAENDQFPTVLLLLSSQSSDIMLLCLRMVCELLKTQAIEVYFRCVETSVLTSLLSLAKQENTVDVHEITIEILFLLSLNGSCRVPVAMEGAIDVFLQRITVITDQTTSFKYATQGLCLCAREAVSRNKMKTDGVLPALVKILHDESLVTYHESIVAAFVWFLFDDSSLGLLIRAGVIPALLKYLERLTLVEYERNQSTRQELFPVNTNVLNEEDEKTDTSDGDSILEKDVTSEILPPLHSIDTPMECSTSFSNENNQYSPSYSSPETSPYYADSPPYSLPSMSPHMSPNYSPPTSPDNPMNQDYDNYSQSSIESTMTANTPYHFQSADGIHAMIHGTRGPIHDTLLLLSRFSQANDPSSFFLFLPGFNSILHYLLLSHIPNPKCGRIFNRLTKNSHCFDLFIRLKLVQRIYLRLATGWSLENLSKLLREALHNKETQQISTSTEVESESSSMSIEEIVQLPSPSTLSLGNLLLSNIRSLSESAYGKGVLSHILLTGSQPLKETCVLALPLIIWSLRLQKRMFHDLKALDILMDLLSNALTKDSETIILIVEAVTTLARLLGLSLEKFDDINEMVHSNQNAVSSMTASSRKRRRRTEDLTSTVFLKLPSSRLVCCDVNKLTNYSLVFEEMFSQDYIDTTKPYIEIRDVHEDAFVSILHYMHGCSVCISQSRPCSEDNCYLATANKNAKRIKKDEALDISMTKEENSDSLKKYHSSLVSSSSVCYFASNLYTCSERFFVDALKEKCEKYLVNTLCLNNVVELLLLALRHNSKIILQNSLVYLLTAVPCPMKRTQFFVEMLSCEEKEAFVSHVRTVLVEASKRKQS